MTKEDKVLWAEWMASTDIGEYAVDIFLNFRQMLNCELSRIWDEGIHITVPKVGECVAYPDKSGNKADVIILTPYDGTLIRVKGDETERIVAELKRTDFSAPWVSGMMVKNILIAKWGENWKEE